MKTKLQMDISFWLIGLAQPDLYKLAAGDFHLKIFSLALRMVMVKYILGSDGSKKDYRGMGGWLDNNESVAGDFVMGFPVPMAESYTLYWTNNLPIHLNIEK